MITIQQAIASKGEEVASIKPDTNVIDAIKTMSAMKIGSLLVIENDRVLGIFTEKDFTLNVASKGQISELVLVKEVMSSPVVAVKPDMTIEEGMAIMTEKRVRHLPVMESDKLVGLVSIGDLVKILIEDQQSTIELLEQYIYC